MMRKYNLLLILLLVSFSLQGFELVLKNGVSGDFPNSSFTTLPREDLVTFRTREEGTRRDTWQGIRLDNWLRENDLRDWSVIRFESDDRYLVSFEQVAFDTTSCWLMMQQNGREFAPEEYRVIFPNLTQNHWVRNISRIVLEDFRPLPLPKRIYPMQSLLAGLTLHENPQPFVNIRAYRFEEIMRALGSRRKAEVILWTSDGLKLNLEYPKHLQGAVLELHPEGYYGLKSPQIPGGMWMKRIIYVQVNKRAMLDSSSFRKVIDLNGLLRWELGSRARVKQWLTRGSSKGSLPAFLEAQGTAAAPNLRYFRIYPGN